MSSIHFSTARNSELIFTTGDRHLCSSIHPTREAQQWIAHHQAKWRDCRSILVVGLGCGYHVRALKMAAGPETCVLALEPSREVIQAALRVHPLDLSETDLVQWSSIEDIKKSSVLTEATLRSYAVLLHEPSAFANPAQYQEAKDFLLGRQEEGLRWLFANRGVNEESPLSPAMHALQELIA
jgi:hypothetical protein